MTVKRVETIFDILGPSFIGIDQLLNRFDIDPGNSFPPYDIEKLSETDYRVTLAVAGFKQEQLEVTSHEGTLTIKGTKQIEDEIEQAEKREQLIHKGIASRSFERKFTLGEYMEVDSVSLADGLLMVNIIRNVPESALPKKFDIK